MNYTANNVLELNSSGLVSHASLPSSEQTSMPLSALKRGQQATILFIDEKAVFQERLCELGFSPGSLVTVRHKAPLRDPVEYEVRGSRFCLRREDARHIVVEPIERTHT